MNRCHAFILPRWARAARRIFFRALFAVGLCAIVAWPPSVRADETAERKVKTACVPHLAGFVTWPEKTFATPTDPIRIGVLGEFPLDADFEAALAKQTAQGRKLVVAHFTTVDAALGCHVLLVGASETLPLKTILAATAGKPILTIGDHEGFAAQGGVINFIREQGKVRFEINLGTAGAAGLKISSKLLQVARIIPSSAKEKS